MYYEKNWYLYFQKFYFIREHYEIKRKNARMDPEPIHCATCNIKQTRTCDRYLL